MQKNYKYTEKFLKWYACRAKRPMAVLLMRTSYFCKQGCLRTIYVPAYLGSRCSKCRAARRESWKLLASTRTKRQERLTDRLYRIPSSS